MISSYTIGKKPHYVDRGFIKIFVAFLKDIVENPKIAGKSIRLLFYMLEQLDYNTYGNRERVFFHKEYRYINQEISMVREVKR